MNNVHGFRDFNNENNNNRRGPYQNLNQNFGDNIPFMNSMEGDRPPL